MRIFERREARWAAGFAAVFLVSLAFWLFQPNRFDRRVYLFPNHYTSGTGAEDRALPVQATREESISIFVREYLLGPATNRLFRLFPLATRLKTVFFADSVLYVDLDYQSLREDIEMRTDLAKAIEIFKEGIKINFSEIDEVVVTVEGRKPDFEAVTPSE